MAASSIAPYTGREEPPSRCAECNQVLVDALVLTCHHDLCLSCAGNALRATSSLKGRTVACNICGERTQLCEEAAQTLVMRRSQVQSEATFGILDRNHDGVISREEWQTAVAPVIGRAAVPIAPSQLSTPMWGGQASNLNSARTITSGQPTYPSEAARLLQPYIDRWGSGSSEPPSATPSMSRTGDPGLQGGLVGSRGAAPLQVQQELAPSPLHSMQRDDVAPPHWHGRLVHIPRCPEHPDEQATYFCVTCEWPCICAECVVQKYGRHHDHEVMRVSLAHEKLKARAGQLLDEAVALEDEFAVVVDRLAWKKKEVERNAARGRASVRNAFERVRAHLNEREGQLLATLEAYETESIAKLDSGYFEQTSRLNELRQLQENLRLQCRHGNDAVQALNTYAAAKRAIAALSVAFRRDEPPAAAAEPTDEFLGLAGSARAELDLHAEGLAHLEEAVRSLVGAPSGGGGGGAADRPPAGGGGGWRKGPEQGQPPHGHGDMLAMGGSSQARSQMPPPARVPPG